MRRHLEPILTFAAAAYLALGCQSLSSAATGTTGGGGSSSGSGGSGGDGTSMGSGTGGESSEAADTASAKAAGGGGGGAGLAECSVTAELSPSVFLSIPRARATVSATQVRGVLEESNGAAAPVPSTIRGAELLNYYHIDYPLQSSTELTVVPELVPTIVAGQFMLQIGVQSPPADPGHRRPTALTVLVDTSKSMTGEPMKRANAAVVALARSLNQGDVLNLVTTDSDTPMVHRIAAIAGDPAVFQMGPPVTISGAGDLQVGIGRAYAAALAEDSYRAEGINRVVVITDGGGVPGSIDTASVRDHWTTQRIQLVGVGVGSATSYRQDLLDAATTAGHGSNLYLDSVEEAEAVLHQRFGEIMDEAVGDLTVGFELPKIFEVVNAEAVSTAIGESQLATSDLGRGRSMVFRHAVAACPDTKSAQFDAIEMLVTLTWSDPAFPERQSRKYHFNVQNVWHDDASYPFLKTSAVTAFANALQSLQVSRFKDTCAKIALAQAAIPQPQPNSPVVDPELESIKAQILAHPVMKMNSAPCP